MKHDFFFFFFPQMDKKKNLFFSIKEKQDLVASLEGQLEKMQTSANQVIEQFHLHNLLCFQHLRSLFYLQENKCPVSGRCPLVFIKIKKCIKNPSSHCLVIRNCINERIFILRRHRFVCFVTAAMQPRDVWVRDLLHV